MVTSFEFNHHYVIIGSTLDYLYDSSASGTLFNRFANFEAEMNSFSLSPNPASTQTTFKLNNVAYTNDLFLEMVDISGRLQETIRIVSGNEQFIDLTNFESGIYLMNLRNKDALIESQKIILTNR
jgi:hypothetical protein